MKKLEIFTLGWSWIDRLKYWKSSGKEGDFSVTFMMCVIPSCCNFPRLFASFKSPSHTWAVIGLGSKKSFPQHRYIGLVISGCLSNGSVATGKKSLARMLGRESESLRYLLLGFTLFFLPIPHGAKCSLFLFSPNRFKLCFKKKRWQRKTDRTVQWPYNPSCIKINGRLRINILLLYIYIIFFRYGVLLKFFILIHFVHPIIKVVFYFVANIAYINSIRYINGLKNIIIIQNNQKKRKRIR